MKSSLTNESTRSNFNFELYKYLGWHETQCENC